MINSVEPFGEPVNALKSLLGSSYEKEYPALSKLCGLIRAICPKKIIKVGGANGSVTASVLKCIDILHLTCQLFVVDSNDEGFLCTRDIFDLERELQQRELKNCSFFHGNSIASYIDAIGGGVDLLILDAVEAMPNDILDFIVVCPYLALNAMVACCEASLDNSSNNILLQNVTADKFSTCLTFDIELLNCINFVVTEKISLFQINRNTTQSIQNLFAAMHCPWRCIPSIDRLSENDAFIRNNYDSNCHKLFRRALVTNNPYMEMLKKMSDSLLKTFTQVLLYGKGKRGRCFLKFAKLASIPVTGFVVSDGRITEKTFEGLPVYSYSQIPFSPDVTFIFQTAATVEIEQQLQKSSFHWMKLSDSFWHILEYGNS